MMAKRIGNWLASNWERLLFVCVGLVFFAACFWQLYAEKTSEGAVLFGLGFLSFIYANVSRFKRFKGLGFEAELWEDKQKEAADLIERLRDVVSIYTREVILAKVTFMRAGDGPNWLGNWKLYDDLVAQHNLLGQKIDFSDLKKTMDDFFLFDMTMPALDKICEATLKGKAAATLKINEEFGSPICDSEAYGRRLEQRRAIQESIKDAFQISTSGDLAGRALDMWADSKKRLKQDFDVQIEIDKKALERLAAISKLYGSRPVKITSELIAWAEDRGLGL